MPANGLVNVSAGVNFRAESIAIEIGGTYCGPMAYATVFRPTGSRPGFAMITIPHAPTEVARKARSIALNLDGPAGKAPVGEQVICKRRTGSASEPLFAGNVAIPEHDLDNDNLLVISLDGRYQMQDIRAEGSFVINPKVLLGTAGASDPEYYYVEGQLPIFNIQGCANGYRLKNGIKVFTPWKDFGLKGDQIPGDAGVQLEYFTLNDIVNYLWYFHGPDAPIDDLISGYYPWLKKTPSNIYWPRDMAAVIDESAVENFNDASGQGSQKLGGARKGREVNLDGVSVLDAIEQMLQTAGGYTLAIGADEAHDNDTGETVVRTELKIVPAMFREAQRAHTMEVASGGQAAETLTRPMIQKGRFSEDGTDYINRLAAVGDRTKIETRASMDASPAQLRVRWNAATSLAARTRIAADPTARGLANAFMEYDSYLAEWELDPDWDFQTGTDQAGRSRLPAPRPVLPRLLSFMSSARGARDYAALQYPIRVEYKDGSTWKQGPELDGLEILDDGGIRIPRLRQDMINWTWTNGAFHVGTDGGVEITERKIRLTLAIPCDHRIAAMGVIASKMVGYPNAEVVNCVDVGRTKFTDLDRVGFKSLRGLYREWRRISSWPIPESFYSGNTAADDLATAENPLLSDMSLLKPHVRHAIELAARIRKGGTLTIPKRLTTAFPLGYQVDWFEHVGGALDGKQFPAFLAIAALLWSNEPENTRTEITPI